MYTIKQKDKQALCELSGIVQALNTETAFDKRAFIEAKISARKAQHLINLVLDDWREERTYA